MEGFSQPKKSVPYYYFYDDEGSKINASFNESPFYYLAKSEIEILQE